MKYQLLAGVLLTACLLTLPMAAQSTPPFPVALEKELAGRASHYTEVSMDKKMLAFASKFLNDKEEDDVQAKRLLEKLDSIYVREYDFDKPGQYSHADLERIRSQFAGSDWSPMVRERSKTGEEDTDVYVKMANGKVQGMFVLDAEPKELDLVYIVGSIDPEELTKLDGNFGIPKGIGAHMGKRSSK